jgi:hypothetical protein
MNLDEFIVGVIVGAYAVGCILFGFVRAFIEDCDERFK